MGASLGMITMSMRETDRLKTIQAVVDRMLRVGQAAERLGVSLRQVERMLLRYAAQGAAGLVSRKRGRPSNHQLEPGLADKAIALVRQRYADFGPTLAREKLLDCHGLALGKETLRHLMMDAGIWSTRRRRAPPIHQPRVRRACLGELVQIDGSDHAWFEDRAPSCTLLVYIDDATSRLMALHFTPTESTFGYFDVWDASFTHIMLRVNGEHHKCEVAIPIKISRFLNCRTFVGLKIFGKSHVKLRTIIVVRLTTRHLSVGVYVNGGDFLNVYHKPRSGEPPLPPMGVFFMLSCYFTILK